MNYVPSELFHARPSDPAAGSRSAWTDLQRWAVEGRIADRLDDACRGRMLRDARIGRLAQAAATRLVLGTRLREASSDSARATRSELSVSEAVAAVPCPR